MAEEEIKELVEETKASYDLRSRLQGRLMRTATVSVYTDEVTAEKHLALENKINALKRSVTALVMIQDTAKSIGLPEAAEALQPRLFARPDGPLRDRQEPHSRNASRRHPGPAQDRHPVGLHQRRRLHHLE